MTTKGLQDRKNLLLDGRTVENKGKLILINIVTSKQNRIQFEIKLISKYKNVICAWREFYLNSREKLEPRPEFEPRTSEFEPLEVWGQIPV